MHPVMTSRSKGVKEWDQIIRPKSGWFDIDIPEIWRYRDLILLFVRRDFVSIYKQTVLGPSWYLFQPLLTTIIFTLVFSNFAKIPTDGLPPMLFYMAGTVCWNYFSDSMRKTSATFVNNSNILGRVYFPRLAIPISIVISTLISFLIQLFFLVAFLIFYALKGYPIHLQYTLFLLPLLVLLMAAMGLGIGIIISAMTTKYRDLTYLVAFGIQLLMYATPVIYSVGGVSPRFQTLILLNPMSSVIELFRYSILGTGYINLGWILYSTVMAFIILFIGVLAFNRVEKTFLDTI